MTPGASVAIVTRNALAGGRAGGLMTTAGIASANSLHATAAALGLSLTMVRAPAVFLAIQVAGAAYLSWLGVHALRRAFGAAWRPSSPGPAAVVAGPWIFFRHGLLTNLLNAPVVLFYLAYVPQFIAAGDGFARRFALLASIHIALSVAWLACCTLAIDRLAIAIASPRFRVVVEGLAGVALLVFGVLMLVARR